MGYNAVIVGGIGRMPLALFTPCLPTSKNVGLDTHLYEISYPTQDKRRRCGSEK